MSAFTATWLMFREIRLRTRCIAMALHKAVESLRKKLPLEQAVDYLHMAAMFPRSRVHELVLNATKSCRFGCTHLCFRCLSVLSYRPRQRFCRRRET